MVSHYLDTRPRTAEAWQRTLDHLADGRWHLTADVERHLMSITDLAPRTIKNLLERMSARHGGKKPLSRRGNALGKADTREIRLR